MAAELVTPDNQEEIDEAQRYYDELTHRLERAETISLLNGPYDKAAAIVTLHAGAGGVDAQDWTEILLRMYMRWAENEGYKVSLVEYSPAEEDGIHSASLIIEGFYPFGMLSSEYGVHRLVRISPYDAAHRRHTSFAKVEIVPELGEELNIELRPEDLKIDTYRSQGAGGQHVNKTESCIRMTHLPTGIVVTCQDERSQLKNREKAMKVMKSRLYDYYNSQYQSEYAENRKNQIGTGDRSERIRTYNFPQGRITDHRIGYTAYNLDEFLLGDIDAMVEALTLADREARLAGEED